MNYVEQLEKAILFIEDNLKQDIKVEDVASCAGYSYYHFHRIFEALVGETVGNYVRSRRLTRAANDLLYSESSLLDIALGYQFESQQAFNRAFKKVFGVTPGTYRKNRIEVFFGGKRQLDIEKLRHLVQGVTMQPQIRETDTILVIGIRRTTTLRNNLVPQMWDELTPRMYEIPHRTEMERGYSICEVDPDYDMNGFNEDTEFSEVVGMEVHRVEVLPTGMIAKEIPAGRYAVFTHKGPVSALHITYHYIWGTWLPGAPYELDLRDDFEFYDSRFLGRENESSEMDIYIPIK